MPRFRKKPVEIDAHQIPNPKTSEEDARKMAEIAAWCGGEVLEDAVGGFCIFIETLEGQMKGQHGDWVIKDIAGEFYPCKPDIFEATYDLVEG